MERVYSEKISFLDVDGVSDVAVALELDFEEGNKFLMINILWSVLLFIFSMVI